jgi:PKD repeat protein
MYRIVKQLIEKHLLTLIVLVALHLGVKAQCNASFTVSVDSVSGMIQCTNTSVVGTPDSPTVYTWYEIPGIVLSNNVNPSIPLSEGTHSICLKVENNGCIDFICTPISIPPRYCLARFSYSVDLAGQAQFTNTSVAHNGSFLWSFGDGVSFSTDSNTSHTYGNGWYYACLNIRNNDSSCSDVTCSFIRIQKPTPSPCVANFDYAYDTSNSKKVYFTNRTYSDSSIHVVWLFPSEKIDTLEQTDFTFPSVGNYTVCLLVSGPLCADSVCKMIEIITIIPTCDAQFTYQLFADTALGGGKRIAVFNNQSNGTNLAYKWLVNDSLVSEETNPIYYYPADGNYEVCLVAYNLNFCSDSMCKNILIESVGLADQPKPCSVTLSPNPTQSDFFVEVESCNEVVEYICVYNAFGDMVTKQIQQTPVTRVSLLNWAKGMYIVEVKTSNNLYHKKLTKL